MKLVNCDHGLKLEIKENRANVLVIENKQSMREIINDLYEQINGRDGSFILSEDDKELGLHKNATLLIDPFSLNYNERKIVNKIYSDLNQYALEMVEEREQINSKIVSALDNIIGRSVYENLSFDLDLDWLGLLKFYNVKILCEESGLLEKLIEYEKIIVNVLHHRLLILVNIKNYLDDDEILELYKMAAYQKLQLLLIEAKESINLSGEATVIVDNDRCIILK